MRKLFTFLFAFLATLSGAVWGQSYDAALTVGGNAEDKLIISSGWRSIYISMNTKYQKSNDQIIVPDHLGNIEITLDNIDIDVRLGADTKKGNPDPEVDNNNAGHCALEIGSGTYVTLKWIGNNKLWSSSQRAGINVKPGAILKMVGPDVGSLEAGSLCNGSSTNITHGAGIGGDQYEPSFGTIIIESGEVTAISQARAVPSADINAAAIGGGYDQNKGGSKEGSIIILGGNVTAKCEYLDGTTGARNGANIGSSYRGTCDEITILGGVINASDGGTGIGNGNGTQDRTQPQVIIAPETQEETLDVTGNVVNVNNQLDYRNQSKYGSVTIPADKQVYIPNLNNFKGGGTVNAFHINLTNTEITNDPGHSGEHTISNFPAEIVATYYGKATTLKEISIPVDLTCSWEHHFMGWFRDRGIDENDVKATIPRDKEPTGIDDIYSAKTVWVDNHYDIVVENGHTWVADDPKTNAPTIPVVPEEAVNSLMFELNKGAANTRLDLVDLSDNKFIGTPLLLPDEQSANLDNVFVTVKVIGGQSEGKKVETPIFIHSGNLVVESITLTSNHKYTGSAHNNSKEDPDHAFSFEVSGLPEGYTLTEGVHFYVSEYTYEGKIIPETKEGESVQFLNAGDYTNIKLKAIMPELGEQYAISFKTNTGEEHETTLTGPLSISQQNLTITFNELTEEHIGKTLNVADFCTYEGNLVGQVPAFEGTIEVASTLNENGKYDVIFTGVKIKDNNSFLVKNYNPIWNLANGISITLDKDGNGKTEIDNPNPNPDGDGDGDEDGDGDSDIRLYRIYTDEVCAGVELEYSREVVKGGQSTIVTVNVEKGYDASALKLSYKEGMYGEWKPLTLNKDGQYQIKNIWNDIYVRAEGVVTGMEDIDGTARVYAKDGSLYIYTPQQDDIAVISMTGSVVKRTKQIGLQSYPLNQGIYVVRVGEQVFKVRVK